MKILIGMPAYFGIHPEVVRNLLTFDLNGQKESNEVVFSSPQNSLITLSRNICVKKAISENCDWLLFWDSDIQIKDDNFFRLMKETAFKFDAPVVGLPCRLKTPDEIVFNFAVKIEDKYMNFKENPDKPMEIDVIGTGVMLINMKWLKANWSVGPWFTVIDTQAGAFPEDWNFCEKVKKLGGKIMVDPQVKTVHWGLTGFTF